jgi:phosphoribosylformylglycinamidine synthase
MNSKDHSPTIIEAHGLTSEEYIQIKKILGRSPNITELGIFSAMWNEHCSYKSSRKWLKELPSKGDQVICGPGENAGIVAIDEKIALAFKMESHNHPSFIEPFNGAATGVGGILRDVFTMGARPIAVMNSLSMGSANNIETKEILSGVVKGISHYGNSFGVPNVGGELRFDSTYNGNCLVNAFAAGIVNRNKIFYSKASGIGSPIVYMGAKTGRDGVGGASMASESFESDNDRNKAKRPTVQIGDPFLEKKLMEACFELMESGCVIAIQDMGAAGLTCSSVEMGDKGDLGIFLNLDKVPVREDQMTPYEIMLSESQERMLAVIRPGHEDQANKIFSKWDLDFAVVGNTIEDDKLLIKFQNEIVADLPLKCLADQAPQYDRPWKTSERNSPYPLLPKVTISKAIEVLLSSPNHSSKRWVWEQYDHMILNNTQKRPGLDAGITKIYETNYGLAFSCDSNPLLCSINPFEGGKQAVAECYRNIISSGGAPLAITDNLNFGSPEDPEIMGQFVNCIKGIREACIHLNFPVVSGNVSFYNQTDGKSILPTPTIGGVGLIKDITAHSSGSVNTNDVYYLVGETDTKATALALVNELSLDQVKSVNIKVNLEDEKRNGQFILDLFCKKLISSAHDVSDGGIALALCELAIVNSLGFRVIEGSLEYFFNETQGRYIISINPLKEKQLIHLAKEKKVTLNKLGVAEGTTLSFGSNSLHLDHINDLYHNAISNMMDIENR